MRFVAGKTGRFIFSLLLACCCGIVPLAAEESVVTIERARQTSYYTDEATGDEIIVFGGDVEISVVQGKTTSRIRADQVNFNRSQNLLYASGNVTLHRDTGNGEPENLSAESLLFNVNTEEGIFNDGTVVQTGADGIGIAADSNIIVSAELFARDDSGTVAFKKGSLTFCEDPDPHWKINASRIWLLPGNEFAFANALLYVGKVPIMYFPFFYYPKDELIFNPVFGYEQRKGYFIQTTTYLVGRKKPAENTDDDSFFSFLNSGTMYKQRREGLVLRNLEEKDTATYPHTLKFMADYYTNLGGMVGIDGVFTPESAAVSKLDFALNLGFSRTLFPFTQGGVSIHTPYDQQGDTHYNNSYFAGLKLPFRYQGRFNLTLVKPFSLNVSLPLHSDPFFGRDFLDDREETMDWFDFALSGGGTIGAEEDTSTGEISSFLWRMNASVSPNVSVLSPYLSSVSLSPSFDLNFYTLTDSSSLTDEEKSVSPERKSFYPGLIKPFYFSGTLSGTLFSYPFAKGETVAQGWGKNIGRSEVGIPDDLMSEEERLAKQEEESSSEKDESEDSGAGEDGGEDENSGEGESDADETEADPLADLELPKISVQTPALRPVNGIDYKLTYSVQPNFSSEIGYDLPKTREEFKWDDIASSFVYLRVPVTLTSSFGYRDSFVSLTNSLVFSPVYQRHPVFKDESRRETIEKNDYMAQKLDLNSNNTLTFSPFVYNPFFSGTNISWNTNLRVIRTNFIGTVEEPEWEYQLPEWDADSFASHSLTANFKSQQDTFSQQLSLQTVLPPLRESYSGTLTLGFPFVTASLGTGVQRKSIDDKEWVFQPVNQSLNVSVLDNRLTFSQSYRYNIEDAYHDSLTLRLSGFGVTAAYNMRYVAGYDYDKTVGWKLRQDKEFQASSFELTYANSNLTKTFWKNRIKIVLGLNTGIHYNFLQPTNSYFRFAPSVTFTINEFLDLTFSASSRNDVVYRYIQEFTGFEPKIPGETNVFKDLWNSFSFWDRPKREASGFKLKSLEVGLEHELHDWTLSSKFSVSPRIVTEGGKRFYDFSPHFTLSVVWKPMSSMKTTIEDKYGTVTLNP